MAIQVALNTTRGSTGANSFGLTTHPVTDDIPPLDDSIRTKENNSTFSYKTFSSKGLINEPAGGWQILRLPKHIVPEHLGEQGIFIVELNIQKSLIEHEGGQPVRYMDLSDLNDSEKISRLEYELSHLTNEMVVKHLLLSFYGCKNLKALGNQTVHRSIVNFDGRCPSWNSDSETVSGVAYIAEFLQKLDNKMAKRGAQISIIRNEPSLHDHLAQSQFSIKGQIHEDHFDAIRYALERKSNTAIEPQITRPIPSTAASPTEIESPNSQWPFGYVSVVRGISKAFQSKPRSHHRKRTTSYPFQGD